MSNIIDSIQLSGVTYTIQGSGGGGKAIEAGRGISVTTGATADTVSFNLPISAGTRSNSIIENFNGNVASGAYSHAEGFGTITNNEGEHASGKYNVSHTGSTEADNTLFSVGNGTYDEDRRNAFEIREDGSIFISSGYTTIKLQDHIGGGGNPTVELTQAEYDALVTAGTVSADTYYIITDAQAGDLTNYYTKTETNTLLGGKADTATTYTKTETDNAITAATSTKQDTLVSSENIKTINNTSILGSGNIDIQGGGGGKAIEAGRGISITTGETADTVSFDLPISAGTGTGSLIIGDNGGGTSYASVASSEGAVVFPSRKYYGKNYATGESSFAHGNGCSAMTHSCHAEGHNTKCNGGFNSHSEGENTEARGNDSHSEGSNTLAGENYMRTSCHAEGSHTSAMTNYSHTEGYYTIANNEAEHASGKYNVSNKANGTFGDSGNTLFSVGNGTAENARHNAFEIRQNGDIYYFDGTNDVKLQDKFSSIDTTIGDINTILQSI